MTDATLRINRKVQPPDLNTLHGSGVATATTQFAVPEEHAANDEVAQLETDIKDSQADLSDSFFLNLATQAFDVADPYYQTNIKPELDNAYKAYMSRPSAKQLNGFDVGNPEGFIYRPKTRTIIEKNKAAAFASFFTNPDIVSIEAENPSDKGEVITASVAKHLLNYRLTKTIPWKQLCIGGFDDAMTTGLCCYYLEWDKKKKKEGPVIDLVPLDNMRWDPTADWADIVGSSPYLIMLIPYYVGELMEKIESGVFDRKLSRAEIAAAYKTQNKALDEKQPGNRDPSAASAKSGVNDYQTVIVQLHVHRIRGEDWIFYTLNNERLLTTPEPLEEVHLHGVRPFVIGSVAIEPHVAYTTPFPNLVAPIQDEMNILATQRRTNVDMAMNRKWRIDPELGDEVDPAALLSNAPSLVAAPKDGLEPLDQPDVTQNAYQEQQLLDNDFNEMSGNFNVQPNATARMPNDTPYKTHQMLNSNANMLVDVRLAIFAATVVEPLFGLLIKLEQKYEQDDVILALVGQQAGVFTKNHKGQMDFSNEAKQSMGAVPAGFQAQAAPQPVEQTGQPTPGPNAAQLAGMPAAPAGATPTPTPPAQSPNLPPGISIETLLSKNLLVKVNVGLNATAPDMKLQRFMTCIQNLMAILKDPAHVIFDVEELCKEVMGLSGYGDGKRFINQQQNPEVVMLRQQLMQLMQMVQRKMPELQMKEKIADQKNATQILLKTADVHMNNAELRQDAAAKVLDHSREMQQTQQQLGQMPDAQQPQPEGQPQ